MSSPLNGDLQEGPGPGEELGAFGKWEEGAAMILGGWEQLPVPLPGATCLVHQKVSPPGCSVQSLVGFKHAQTSTPGPLPSTHHGFLGVQWARGPWGSAHGTCGVLRALQPRQRPDVWPQVWWLRGPGRCPAEVQLLQGC